ncbi:DUF3024 domain-containing protein [Desulfuromonas sp.]|uniref:DUF3024 domain-containing protein n=1 Tax=Desulfuromonas sp. TaxID=892 RepID=UPI0025C6C53B|nr:DUF3024 domain-containing protein [Desulfuromonas sp.]
MAKADGSGPHPSPAAPLAQFRFHSELGQWTLHYPGAQNRWHIFLNAGPTLNLERLLRHLDEDPLNLFWE